MIDCVYVDSILHMADTPYPLSVRVSPLVKARITALQARYDASLAMIVKVALVLGIEALEGLSVSPSAIPKDPFVLAVDPESDTDTDP